MAFSNITIGKNIDSPKTVNLPSEDITKTIKYKFKTAETADLEVAISDFKKALKVAKKGRREK